MCHSIDNDDNDDNDSDGDRESDIQGRSSDEHPNVYIIRKNARITRSSNEKNFNGIEATFVIERVFH